MVGNIWLQLGHDLLENYRKLLEWEVMRTPTISWSLYTYCRNIQKNKYTGKHVSVVPYDHAFLVLGRKNQQERKGMQF